MQTAAGFPANGRLVKASALVMRRLMPPIYPGTAAREAAAALAHNSAYIKAMYPGMANALPYRTASARTRTPNPTTETMMTVLIQGHEPTGRLHNEVGRRAFQRHTNS